MCTGMQDDDSSRRCLAQIHRHSRKVKILVLSVPVAVLPEVGEASSFKDVGVVGPGGLGVVDCVLAENPVEEDGTNSQRVSATVTLEGCIQVVEMRRTWTPIVRPSFKAEQSSPSSIVVTAFVKASGLLKVKS